MRILVVEDHGPTIELLVDILRGDGHEVVAERDGLAGRQRALSEPFDLILCDIGLPRLDGLGVARAIRAAGMTTPLVALTGNTSEDDRMLGITAGFDSYLLKPITASALLREMAVRDATRKGRASVPPTVSAGASTRQPPVAVLAGAAMPQGAPATAPGPAKRRRGVLGGLVVIAMGLPFLLQPLGVPNAAAYLFPAMGMAFLISYLRG
ncbi:MAG: response regulator, partial [Chloroflexota bacterium]